MKRDLHKLKYWAWNIAECVEIWSWFIKYWMDKALCWNIYLLLITIQYLEDITPKLKKLHFKTIPQHFFNNHVVNNWNNLPYAVVNATSINSFKRSLINIGVIGCIWHEKYKQTIYFLPLIPGGAGCELGVHNMFTRHCGHFLNVLCMFQLCQVLMGISEVD